MCGGKTAEFFPDSGREEQAGSTPGKSGTPEPRKTDASAESGPGLYVYGLAFPERSQPEPESEERFTLTYFVDYLFHLIFIRSEERFVIT